MLVSKNTGTVSQLNDSGGADTADASELCIATIDDIAAAITPNPVMVMQDRVARAEVLNSQSLNELLARILDALIAIMLGYVEAILWCLCTV